jgi:hypothetical protein
MSKLEARKNQRKAEVAIDKLERIMKAEGCAASPFWHIRYLTMASFYHR